MTKKVLLADDEQIIRTGISTLISWDKLDMELVYCAENGRKAFEFISTHPVDIAITDIRMPLMGGLELISACDRAGFSVRFILLTGYGEFEYAKSAMRYGVRHYLLKPTDETQIIQALREISAELDRNHVLPVPSGDIPAGVSPTPHQDTVEKVRLIVNEELSNPELSLKWIAHNKLFMNENYLGKLFLKKTGKKFTNYLTDTRMQRAKELISQNPDIKLAELCQKTGFINNPAYFCTSFKNYSGLTLTQYRQGKF